MQHLLALAQNTAAAVAERRTFLTSQHSSGGVTRSCPGRASRRRSLTLLGYYLLELVHAAECSGTTQVPAVLRRFQAVKPLDPAVQVTRRARRSSTEETRATDSDRPNLCTC